MNNSTMESVRFGKVLLAASLGAALLAGLTEWVLLWVSGPPAGVFLMAGLLVLGVWGLMAGLLALIEQAAGFAMFGWGRTRHGVERFTARLMRCWQERYTLEDARRGSKMISWELALVTLVGLTLAFGAWLTQNTQGRFLMVVTLVGAQALFFVVALLVRRMSGRLLEALLQGQTGRAKALRLALSLCTQSLLLALGLLAAGLYMLARQFEFLADTDAISLGLPLAALVVQAPVLVWACGRTRSARVQRFPLWAWWASVVLVSLALVWLGAQSSRALNLVKGHSWTAKYLVVLLEKASDLDSDGFPAFPAAVDCSPLDPAHNPLSAEVPGNGVDENCDGVEADLPDASAVDPASRADSAGSQAPVEIPLSQKPDLILITVDALRADHLGFMGYERPTSPALDLLAQQATVFTAAFSQDSGTGPSFWSLMAGTTPFQARFKGDKGFPLNLALDQPTLAELLAQRGYATHARVCGSMFSKKRWTIKRGFKEFKEVCKKSESGSALLVLKTAQATLTSLRRSKQPFFLWIHFFDPHHPYTPHDKYQFGDSAIDKYDSEVAFATDAATQLIQDALSGNRPAYVFLAADHGENFGEHGTSHHARTLYREVTHVPLVAWGPGVEAQRVEEAVALNDLHPTLLQLAGTDNPQSTMVSLVPSLAGNRQEGQRIVLQENSFSRPVQHVKGAIQGDYHLLWNLSTGSKELYRWRLDPQEKEDLADQGILEEEMLSDAISALLQSSVLPDSLR